MYPFWGFCVRVTWHYVPHTYCFIYIKLTWDTLFIRYYFSIIFTHYLRRSSSTKRMWRPQNADIELILFQLCYALFIKIEFIILVQEDIVISGDLKMLDITYFIIGNFRLGLPLFVIDIHLFFKEPVVMNIRLRSII